MWHAVIKCIDFVLYLQSNLFILIGHLYKIIEVPRPYFTGSLIHIYVAMEPQLTVLIIEVSLL